MKRRICHIVDDSTPGGITRLLDFVAGSSGMASLGQHDVRVLTGGMTLPPRIDAEVIVSHMVLSWKNLPFFTALRRRNGGVPMIHVEHSYSEAFADAHVPAPGRFRAMLRANLSQFDRVVAISTAQQAWLARFASVSSSKLHLIRSCVDLSDFLAVPERPAGAFRRVGAIGRLHPQKGFDILIPAFLAADLPDVTLDIVGDGPERARLASLANGDPRIVFHGHTDRPSDAMAMVDAVAMPSRREPYGLVALEALAAGRPALVANVDGLADSISAGAISVPDLCPDSWRDGLIALATGDHSARVAQGRAHAANAEARFVDGWSDLLAQLQGSRTTH